MVLLDAKLHQNVVGVVIVDAVGLFGEIAPWGGICEILDARRDEASKRPGRAGHC